MPNIIDKFHLIRRDSVNRSYASPYVYLGLAMGGSVLLVALIIRILSYLRKMNMRERELNNTRQIVIPLSPY